MMKQFLCLLICLVIISCEKKKVSNDNFKDYNIDISTDYYDYNLKSGEFKIRGYEFIDTVSLTKIQLAKIEKIFYELHIDTLNGNKNVFPNQAAIMPDSRYKIKISINNNQKSKLLISGQLNDETKLNKVESNVFKFNKKLFDVLNENKDFKNCLDTLKKVEYKLPPLL